MKFEVAVRPGITLEVKENWISEKQKELEQGCIVLAEMEKIEGISKSKLGRMRGRLKFLEKFIELLKEGFIPIPRMDFEPIDIERYHYGKLRSILYLDKLPVGAIATIAEFQDKFDHLGVVRPRAKKRDPILIGILQYGQYEEHFILGWWRPDMMKPWELW